MTDDSIWISKDYRKMVKIDRCKADMEAKYRIEITNLAHVYREVISLQIIGHLWHMDDDPKDCFSEFSNSFHVEMAELQNRLWDVCRYEGVCLHGVCHEVLNFHKNKFHFTNLSQ